LLSQRSSTVGNVDPPQNIGYKSNTAASRLRDEKMSPRFQGAQRFHQGAQAANTAHALGTTSTGGKETPCHISNTQPPFTGQKKAHRHKSQNILIPAKAPLLAKHRVSLKNAHEDQLSLRRVE